MARRLGGGQWRPGGAGRRPRPTQRIAARSFRLHGQSIRATGLDGPYTLTDVFVTRLADGIANLYFDDVHRTAPYLAAQFGATPILLDRLEQAATDLNGNGLYDLLTISATVAAIDREGNYTWRGRLVAPDGSELGVATGSGQLFRDKTLALRFLGGPIRRTGLDGAYALRDVVITHQSMPTLTVTLPQVYATTEFAAAAFDAAEFASGGAGVQVLDLEENGLYDKLVFTTVLTIPLTGTYWITRSPTRSAGML